MNLKENLADKYVAYLDVLGFKELVFKRKIEDLEIYFSTIHKVLDDVKSAKQNIQSLLVSDSVILIAPNTKEDFKILIRAVQTIQTALFFKNIWIRGAVSFGEIHFDTKENLIVGKGLINAYLLEQLAKYPRVIIDPSVIPRIEPNRESFYQFINPDSLNSDVNNLKLVHDGSSSNEDFFVAYGHKVMTEAVKKRELEKVYKLVLENIYSTQMHYEKYLWVKKYFIEVLTNMLEMYSKNSGKSSDETIYIKQWFDKFPGI